MAYLLQVYGLVGFAVTLAVFLTFLSIFAGVFLVSGTRRFLKGIQGALSPWIARVRRRMKEKALSTSLRPTS